MFEANSLITASAGTGKTFAIATRFIRLLMFDRVAPETIVALTFSRAAAQEIYTKILTRLCDAAEDDAGAEREWQTLLDDFERGRVPLAKEKLAAILAQNIPHGAADFRALLRRLADAQHLGTIATLDSFILRIVRYFPREMGFQHAVEVLDPQAEGDAVDEAVRSVFARTDGAGAAVAEAFVTATKGEALRTCLDCISRILNREGWRDFAVAHPACANWTVASMCAALDVPMASECPDLSAIPFNDMGRKNAVSPEEKFVQFAHAYDGSVAPLDTTEAVRALMLFFWNNPDATSYDYSFFSKPFTLDCGTDGAVAIRGAIRHMANVYLKRQLEVVEAKLRLVAAVEGVYDKATRRAGKLTFGDFTKFSGESEFSERGIALKNVAFRFDSRFDHWALDEFQDTSELQWHCLRELVGNAAEAGFDGECRTAMAVGDLKQSIYAWRGASARPFVEVTEWPAFVGCTRELTRSYRYGPNIAAFVNSVFGSANVVGGGVIPDACAEAVREWQDGWSDHVANASGDYVKVIGVEPNDDPEADDALLAALGAEVQSLWARHQAAGSAETVGVLVRGNADGSSVAEYLRAQGLPVVWEGMNAVHDLPSVQAVLALLRLGDHPEDTAAWQTVETLWDIRRTLLPDATDAASASTAVSRLLTRQGLARTAKDFCMRLKSAGRVAEGGLAASRLEQLVSCAVAFEARGAADGGVDAFVRFLEKSQMRELAVSSDVIRILTIHRSKGLGIDHVFVPLFEHSRGKSAIDRPKGSAPLFGDGDWVLPHVSSGCETLHDKTRRAYAKMRSQCLAEALRTYYVALTRAKKSMIILFPNDVNPADRGKGLLMRDLVANAVNGALPFEAGTPPMFQAKADEAKTPPVHMAWQPAGKREIVERVSPSYMARTDGKAADANGGPFAANFGAAAQRGIDVHAAYREIEWLSEDAAAKLPSAFREAFVRPSPDATVWRERAYEIFDGKRWETGHFDRVVFANGQATIYDFKTNTRREGESVHDFATRMSSYYAPQMNAYRRAIITLTKLPPERIVAVLLLEATGEAVKIA